MFAREKFRWRKTPDLCLSRGQISSDDLLQDLHSRQCSRPGFVCTTRVPSWALESRARQYFTRLDHRGVRISVTTTKQIPVVVVAGRLVISSKSRVWSFDWHQCHFETDHENHAKPQLLVDFEVIWVGIVAWRTTVGGRWQYVLPRKVWWIRPGARQNRGNGNGKHRAFELPFLIVEEVEKFTARRPQNFHYSKLRRRQALKFVWWVGSAMTWWDGEIWEFWALSWLPVTLDI